MGLLFDLFCDLVDPMSFNASEVKTKEEEEEDRDERTPQKT